MSTTKTQLKNLRELRDFLNSQSDEVLDDKIRFVSSDEQIHNISEVAILDEDFIDPTGEFWEPVSAYSSVEGEDNTDKMTNEELAKEPRVGLKGQYFFTV